MDIEEMIEELETDPEEHRKAKEARATKEEQKEKKADEPSDDELDIDSVWR